METSTDIGCDVILTVFVTTTSMQADSNIVMVVIVYRLKGNRCVVYAINISYTFTVPTANQNNSTLVPTNYFELFVEAFHQNRQYSFQTSSMIKH